MQYQLKWNNSVKGNEVNQSEERERAKGIIQTCSLHSFSGFFFIFLLHPKWVICCEETWTLSLRWTHAHQAVGYVHLIIHTKFKPETKDILWPRKTWKYPETHQAESIFSFHANAWFLQNMKYVWYQKQSVVSTVSSSTVSPPTIISGKLCFSRSRHAFLSSTSLAVKNHRLSLSFSKMLRELFVRLLIIENGIHILSPSLLVMRYSPKTYADFSSLFRVKWHEG